MCLKIRTPRVRVVVVKVFLFSVKILKFLNIFAISCFFYLFAYAVYTIFSIAKHVDAYCIPSIFILIATLYWFVIGVTMPQFLPFFKVKSRILVGIATIFFVSILFLILVLIEIYVYKRPPVKNIMLNGYKFFVVAKKINPLEQRFKRTT